MSERLGGNIGCNKWTKTLHGIEWVIQYSPMVVWHRVNSIMSGRNPPLCCTLTLLMSSEKIPVSCFSTIHQNGFIFCTKKTNTCGSMSVPIRSRHMGTETPARGARGQGWRGWFLNSTKLCPSRCMRVKVYQRARRPAFLCLCVPCAALFRGAKNRRLQLDLKLEGILDPTCRAPTMWLVGVES